MEQGHPQLPDDTMQKEVLFPHPEQGTLQRQSEAQEADTGFCLHQLKQHPAARPGQVQSELGRIPLVLLASRSQLTGDARWQASWSVLSYDSGK